MANDETKIGQTIQITLINGIQKLDARVDTGAETSSISAINIQKFERDGKDWIKFDIAHPSLKKVETLEEPLSRTIKVKRHGGESHKRYVVKLKIMIREQAILEEFSLTDRKGYEYPALIGRNILSHGFIVDVNKD